MESILYETPADKVATIGLNRPQTLNALTREAMLAFSEAVDRAAAYGLVNQVTDRGAAPAQALALETRMVEFSPMAVGALKPGLRAGLNEAPPQAAEIERRLFPFV
jgi:enoyl-CoA hydratase/carnithine racemase